MMESITKLGRYPTVIRVRGLHREGSDGSAPSRTSGYPFAKVKGGFVP